MRNDPETRDENGNRIKGRHRVYAHKAPPRGVKRVVVVQVSHTTNAVHTALVSLPLAPWDQPEENLIHG